MGHDDLADTLPQHNNGEGVRSDELKLSWRSIDQSE